MTNQTDVNTILHGDAFTVLQTLPSDLIQTCITSPPYYGLRSYLPDGHHHKHLEIGLEVSPEEYIMKLVDVFREVHRILRPDGTLWVNIGDSYAGSGKGGNAPKCSPHWQPLYAHQGHVPPGYKAKDLYGIPWLLALALRTDGWWLRSTIIWHKPSCLPESVTDRPTDDFEYVFLLTKSAHYFYDGEAIKEPAQDWGLRDRSRGKYTSGIVPIVGGAHKGLTNSNQASTGRNKRAVWSINPLPWPDAHFAVMPPKLIEPCILAGSRPGDIVLDPFMGAGTTALVALLHHRDYLGIELNQDYITMAKKRIATVPQVLWTGESEAVS